MGEIIDKVMLEPEEIHGFLVVDKGQEQAGHDDENQQAQSQDGHPGFGWENGMRINMELEDNDLKGGPDLHVQPHGQHKEDGQCEYGATENKHRVEVPP